jgi:putative tryptophan/tyrosine transport system substrate-binding protein
MPRLLRPRPSTKRPLVAIVLAVALLWGLDAGAQPAARVHRVAVLDASSPDPARLEWWAAFRQQLRELGYVEGQNLALTTRFAHGKVEQLPVLAEELVRLKPDVLVTGGGFQATHAAKQATATIPIVMTTGADPVSLGLVASLARPGGNITGLTTITSELSGKRFQLLRELLPKLSRLAVLWHVNPASALAIPDFEAVARSARVALQTLGVRRPGEFESVFATMERERAEALIVLVSAQFFPERKRLAELAVHHRLPTMHAQVEYVEAGGLVSYAPSYPEFFRRGAVYVDKILKGAKPGDLPIEQPSKLEMVINLKTARALGLTIPQSVLLRADRVID